MSWTGPILAAAALSAAPAPEPSAPPVTRQQAIELAPQDLAAIVLRQIAERVTSVTRPRPRG